MPHVLLKGGLAFILSGLALLQGFQPLTGYRKLACGLILSCDGLLEQLSERCKWGRCRLTCGSCLEARLTIMATPWRWAGTEVLTWRVVLLWRITQIPKKIFLVGK